MTKKVQTSSNAVIQPPKELSFESQEDVQNYKDSLLKGIDEGDAEKQQKDEPTVESVAKEDVQDDTLTDIEQEQETSEEAESDDTKDSSGSVEESRLSPKELRYKEQLDGERKSNRELQARIELMEKQVQTLASPTQQKELTSEERQLQEEKQLLKDKYGVVTKEDYEVLEKKMHTLLEEKFSPIKQEREQKFFDKIYKKYPDVAPTNDPGDIRWKKVTTIMNRFLPANSNDQYADAEERFDWAYEKVFGNKNKVDVAKLRQASYTNIGGGTSAVKTKTVESEDKYAHMSPEARAHKAVIDKWVDEDLKKVER